MPPPGLTLEATPTTGETRAPSTERLIRAAHDILNGCGYEMSAPKVSRLVRRYEATVHRNGWSLFDYLATAVSLDAEQRRRALLNPDVARAIAYADPTGETAVNRVMRERAAS
jgi:hypothetical protein